MTLFNLGEDELRTRTSMKWRTYPDDVLPLWVAEMDLHQHPAVQATVIEAIQRGDTGYPFGTSYAQAYADMAERRWGWRPEPAQMQRSGDVMNAILTVLQATTAEGDHVVITPPVYPPFWAVVQGYGRHVSVVPLTETGRLDLPGLEASFAGPDQPRAFLLCSPHNPTGVVHTPEELAEVGRLCTRFGVQLIVDEIHATLVDPGTPFTPVLALPECQGAVVAFSAGKGWNLAAFKGGLFLRGTEAADVFDRLPPLAKGSTGQFATLAHTAALVHAQDWVDQVMVEVAAHKDLLVDLLAQHLPGVRYARNPATYLAWLDCSALGLDDPQQHFLRQGRVALNSGADFSPEHRHCVRMNLAASPEMITAAVHRMAGSLA